jgi:hypothetical protein
MRAQERGRAHLRVRHVAAVRAPDAARDRHAEVQRVLHVARGMVRRHVQRFEIVEIVLDLRPLEDLVAHAAEDVLDLLPHSHQRMDPANGNLTAGECHVDCASGWPRRLDSGALLLQRRLHVLLERVDGGAVRGAFIRGTRPEFLHQAGDLA